MTDFTAIDVMKALDEQIEFMEYGMDETLLCGFDLPGLGRFDPFDAYHRIPGEPGVCLSIVRHRGSGRLFGAFGSYDSWSGTEIDGDIVELVEYDYIKKSYKEKP